MDSHDNPADDPARRRAQAPGSALESLRKEYVENGRGALYERLKGLLFEQASYAEVADQLGMTEQAVRIAVHRPKPNSGPCDVSIAWRQKYYDAS